MKIRRNWLIYAKVLDMYLDGIPQKHIALILGVSKQRVSQMLQEAARARAHFRLIIMPCYGQMLCWVNPRLPNYLGRAYRARWCRSWCGT
jgi:hypothetical protein